MVALAYRHELNNVKQQIAVYDATLNSTVKEIRTSNERTVRIISAIDAISTANKESKEALDTLGNKINGIPITNVCNTSAPIRTLREWMQQQDSKSPTSGAK